MLDKSLVLQAGASNYLSGELLLMLSFPIMFCIVALSDSGKALSTSSFRPCFNLIATIKHAKYSNKLSKHSLLYIFNTFSPILVASFTMKSVRRAWPSSTSILVLRSKRRSVPS